MRAVPCCRPRAGLALLDLLLAVTLLAIGALSLARPLTAAVASLDAAARAQRRAEQLMAAAEQVAAAARHGDCRTPSGRFGDVVATGSSAPPGVQWQLHVHDASGPPRRRRADTLRLWVPCDTVAAGAP